MNTGRKFYTETESGDIVFHTERKVGDVRIPNYVYDIWLPILGITAIGVYAVYCRLERNGKVKGLTQATLARACRIGVDKLRKVNVALEECGFITVQEPQGHKRLMHYTVEVTVKDPSWTVSQELKDKYAAPSGYEVLTPWLQEEKAESPENPNRFSGEPIQDGDENPDGVSNVAALGLQPLVVENNPPENSDEPSQLNTFFPRDEPVQEGSQVQPAGLPPPGTDIVGAMYHFSARQQPDNWAVPAEAGGADDWDVAVDAFAKRLSILPQVLSDSKRKEWSRQLQKIAGEQKYPVSPEQMAYVIGQSIDSELYWKTWTSPHVAKDDLCLLLAQHLSGGIQKPQPKNGRAVPRQQKQRKEPVYDYEGSAN